MKIIDVTASLEQIEIFPDNEQLEVIQNVKTILTTMQGTVPLDRDFGIDSEVIDKPVNVIRPLIVKEVKEKLAKYEPRVKFISMFWDGTGSEGRIVPTVRVAIR